MASDAAIRCELRTDSGTLHELASDWNRLLSDSRASHAFNSLCWYHAWLEADPKLAPRVWVANRAGRPVALLPLFTSVSRPTQFFPPDLNDSNDLVVGNDLEAARAVLQAAISGSPAGLELACLKADGRLATAAQRLGFDTTGLARGEGPGGECCSYIDLSHGREAWLATRTRSFRAGIARIRRRAERDGLQVGESLPSDLHPADLVATFLRLHRLRIKPTTLDKSPERSRFLQLCLPRLYEAGTARVFTVRVDNRVEAIQLHLRRTDALEYWNGGFSPAIARWSPGRLLFDAAVDTVCAEGLRELDLLRGLEPYKAQWSTDIRHVGGLAIGVNAID